ncbi:hypothetical protein KVR01_002882 [Diaporthe batatas]|uniref:uncharacterized protein n=1 Tax=Diaporthe batatas TaxID=748121 RepID=UPI001D0395EE|nr:uncharacterized protein KVR01_002882 [Diaporthe batatas]KAG8167193.1 hypothetical protein KVR01_002882 [Diaporthe batatas]
MARTTRSKAAAAAPEAVATEAPTGVTTSAVSPTATEKQTVPEKQESKDDSRTKSKQRRANRRDLYKKTRRHRGVVELQKSLESAGKPMGRKERYALRVQTYRPHRQKAKATSKKVSELEDLVKRQQEQIKELRKLAMGTTPRLQPPASPPTAGTGLDEEPDSSPAKIRDQLLTDASRSPLGEGQTVVEVEEVVKRPAGENASGEPMEGVQETTVITSVEQDVEYPMLPSVEEPTQAVEENSGEDVNTASDNKPEDQPEVADGTPDTATNAALKLSADTPIKPKEEVRDSSAEDSHAGTPRNVRRSPRKKTKRRSFAGHSYAG